MVGTRTLLEKDIARAFKKLAQGSPEYCQIRQIIMNRFVADLAAIGRLVSKLAYLRIEDIFSLVDFWRNHGNKTETIQRKITLLRQLMPSKELVPTNEELGIKYHYSKKYITSTSIQVNDVKGEKVKMLCSLQCHFGLKKIEAIRFCNLAFRTGELLISRKIAYNNKERYVPIITDEQEVCLKQFAADYSSGFLVEGCNEMLLSMLHRSELARLKINDSEYFRYLYLKNRNQQLEIEGVDGLKRLKALRLELGYRRNDQIKEILKCLTKH